jgi:hypothetical protein
MAKRARGSTTRPGQRAPLQRTSTPRPTPVPTTPAAPRPATLTAEEEARAAALEAQILADERAAEEASRRSRERSRRSAASDPTARGGTIAMRAADEYGYVVRDLRRVALIGGSLVAILIALWVITELTGIGPF